MAPSTATCPIRPFHIYEREITIQGVMVNPWAFPEAIALVGLLKNRYLNFSKLGKIRHIGSIRLSFEITVRIW